MPRFGISTVTQFQFGDVYKRQECVCYGFSIDDSVSQFDDSFLVPLTVVLCYLSLIHIWGQWQNALYSTNVRNASK